MRELSPYGKKERSKQMRNGKEAYELLLAAFQDRRVMDEVFIKEMQEKLTQNTYDARRYRLGERPGEYKHHDYVTGREEVEAPLEGVAEEMEELLEELLNIADDKALTAAAYIIRRWRNGILGRIWNRYLHS